MKKIIKNKKFVIFIFIFIAFVFFVGLFAKENKKKKEFTEAQIKFLSEPKNVDFLFKIVEEERNKLQHIANIEINRSFINLSLQRTEIETELIKDISPLINNIKIDNQKTEKQYAEEYIYILNKIKNLKVDFSNKKSLFYLGEFIYETAKELSLISTPPSYEWLHKGQIFVLGMLGNALKKLALTDNYQEGMALIQIINNLIEEEKKLANKITK